MEILFGDRKTQIIGLQDYSNFESRSMLMINDNIAFEKSDNILKMFGFEYYTMVVTMILV